MPEEATPREVAQFALLQASFALRSQQLNLVLVEIAIGRLWTLRQIGDYVIGFVVAVAVAKPLFPGGKVPPLVAAVLSQEWLALLLAQTIPDLPQSPSSLEVSLFALQFVADGHSKLADERLLVAHGCVVGRRALVLGAAAPGLAHSVCLLNLASLRVEVGKLAWLALQLGHVFLAVAKLDVELDRLAMGVDVALFLLIAEPAPDQESPGARTGHSLARQRLEPKLERRR